MHICKKKEIISMYERILEITRAITRPKPRNKEIALLFFSCMRGEQ